MVEAVSIPQRMTWTAGQVATAYGCSQAKFLRILPQLEAQGFPRKLPGINAWPRRAVLHWINSSAGTYQPGVHVIGSNDDEIEEIVTELERTYTGGRTPEMAVA